MKRTIAMLLVLCCFAFTMAAFAQDAAGGTTKSDTMGKAMSITGKISEDGASFVSDKDGKSWTISNPEAVKGHEGHHVMVKAHADADKGEIHVTSLKMVKDNMKNDSMQK